MSDEVQVAPVEALYQDYHTLLFAIAYRMLGSATDAEDILQDTFLRYTQAPPTEVRSPKAYLTTITTRLCLDHLKSARAQREQYVGVWLPEPLLTADADETVERRESVSLAFLLMLERLTPYERAVLLLREVFEYSYDEIAEIVGKSPAYCRQILHQAKAHVHEDRARYVASDTQQRLTQGLLSALEQGDMHSLEHLLAEDVAWWADGGGKVYASPRPQVGRERVVRLVRGILRIGADQYSDIRLELAAVNGAAAILVWSGAALMAVISCVVVHGRIQSVYEVLSPDKLQYAQRQALP